MGRLLRKGDLPADERGAVTVPVLAQALTAELSTPVDLETVRQLARQSKRFHLDGELVRTTRARTGGVDGAPPDILYHACTEEQVQHYLSERAT
jgi:hypothetical protein